MSSPAGPGTECSICLGTMSNRAVVDPCRHDFDYDCIKSWTNVNSNCPVCRCPVKYIHYCIVSDREYSVEKVNPVQAEDDTLPYDGFDDTDGDDEDIYDDVDDDMMDDFGSEGEFDEDDEDTDGDSDLDLVSHGDPDEDEWEDLPPSANVSDEENFEAADDGDGAVQVIEAVGINSDDTNGTIFVPSDSENDFAGDDERPQTPDYGDDPGDDGQSEDDHGSEIYEDIVDSDQDPEMFNDIIEDDEWQEANDDFDFDDDDDY